MSSEDPTAGASDLDIEMDVAAAQPAGSEPAAPPPAGRTPAVPHVLVIEDDALVSADIQMSLTEMGYRASGASGSVEEAMRTLRRHLGTVDFVLLDAELSGGSCLPLAHVLDAARVPYLMISGHDEIEIRAMGLTAPYLGKPFGEMELMAAMGRHLPLRAHVQDRRPLPDCR